MARSAQEPAAEGENTQSQNNGAALVSADSTVQSAFDVGDQQAEKLSKFDALRRAGPAIVCSAASVGREAGVLCVYLCSVICFHCLTLENGRARLRTSFHQNRPPRKQQHRRQPLRLRVHSHRQVTNVRCCCLNLDCSQKQQSQVSMRHFPASAVCRGAAEHTNV